ncbi:MAG: hypothetical protein LBV04_01275, partial [Deferribacteraceae bacterium]|nr:hypothetical protein [Deferribacteraceae bacterium]
MDSIKAINLSLYINGRRLDEILSQVHENYLGLIPSWLDYYDEDFAGQQEKQYIWQQTKLSDKPVVLPILLCPDDFDFSCTVIVVEVCWSGDTVVTWSRFGIDVT